MDLTFQEKEIIKSVIEGFTYHQKYNLYVKLAKDLKEDPELLVLSGKPKPPKGSKVKDGKELDTLKRETKKTKIPTGMSRIIR